MVTGALIYRMVYIIIIIISCISSQSDVVLRLQAGQTILHMAALQGQLPTIQHCLSELGLTVNNGVKDKVSRL